MTVRYHRPRFDTDDLPPMPGSTAAPVHNVAHAAALTHPHPLRFRGRSWPARPVGFPEMIRLMELAEAEREASQVGGAAGARAWRGAMLDLMDYAWALVAPTTSRLGRWLWLRLTRNPFRQATFEEVRRILDFFGGCQTISRVGDPSMPDRHAPRTS